MIVDNLEISQKNQTSAKVLLKYLQELRKEMHVRIERAFKLSLYKLLSLGVIISFGILRPESLADKKFALIYSALIPFIAICFDLLIANNYRFMNATGYFIRERIEKHLEEEYNLLLFESESYIFPALMNRVTEIGFSFFVTVYSFTKLPSDLTQTQLFGIKTIIIILLILSSSKLIKSRFQYSFRKDNLHEEKK